MKGVVLWADHIQAIRSRCPILRSTKLFGQPIIFFRRWKINVCKMKGLIIHPVILEHLCGILKVSKIINGVPLLGSHTNALMQPHIFHYISRVVMERGLELMASTLGSNFGKEEVGIQFPPEELSLLQVLSMKDRICKLSS